MAKKNQFHVLNNVQAAAMRNGLPVPCDTHKHASLSEGDRSIASGRWRRVDGLYVEIAPLSAGYDTILHFTPPEPMPAGISFHHEGASRGFRTRQQIRCKSPI